VKERKKEKKKESKRRIKNIKMADVMGKKGCVGREEALMKIVSLKKGLMTK